MTEEEICCERDYLIRDGSEEENVERVSDYETAIKETGYGRFHYALLFFCGWALSSDAIEILCISFMIPAATCDLSMSSADKGWLNASIFIGMILGGYIWGTLADIKGRKTILLWSLSVNAVGGLVSTLSQTYGVFVFFRIISGFGVGGNLPVIFTYFIEFQPKTRRGPMIGVLATFWMFGNVIAAGLAWLVIPHTNIGIFLPKFTYNSWRIFAALCTLPSLSSVFILLTFPESPKFLIYSGRPERALKVLQKIHRDNKKSVTYPVQNLEIPKSNSSDVQFVHSSNYCVSVCQFFCHNISQLFKTTILLFAFKYRRVTFLMIAIFFTLSFGYYGLWMWLPELFARIEKYGGSPCQQPALFTNLTHNMTVCVSEINNNVYFESFLTSLSNLPGNVLTVILIDKVGRKILLSSSMIISAASSLAILLLKNRYQSVIFSCVFGGISVVGWSSLDVLVPELFPTHLRSTSQGLLQSISKFAAICGNLIFGQLIDVHCAVPIAMVTGFMFIGGIITIFLPRSQEIDIN